MWRYQSIKKQCGKLNFWSTRPKTSVPYMFYTKYLSPRPIPYWPSSKCTRIGERASASFPYWKKIENCSFKMASRSPRWQWVNSMSTDLLSLYPSSLLQVIACEPYNTKALPDPVTINCELLFSAVGIKIQFALQENAFENVSCKIIFFRL